MLKGNFVKYLSLVALMVTCGWAGANPSWESITAVLASVVIFAEEEFRHSKRSYAPEYNATDLALFKQFILLFPSSSPCTALLKYHDFGQIYDGNLLNPIRDFISVWNDAQHTFISSGLEFQKRLTISVLMDFIQLLALKTGEIWGDSNMYVIYPSHEPPTEGTKSTGDQINVLANKSYEAIQDFIITGRMLFKDCPDV